METASSTDYNNFETVRFAANGRCRSLQINKNANDMHLSSPTCFTETSFDESQLMCCPNATQVIKSSRYVVSCREQRNASEVFDVAVIGSISNDL